MRIAPLATAMDWVPTLGAIAGALGPDLPIDGKDIRPLLSGDERQNSPYEAFAYYARGRLEAVRVGTLKRVFENPLRSPPVASALYDLATDPGERTNVLADRPADAVALDEALRPERADGFGGCRSGLRRVLGQAVVEPVRGFGGDLGLQAGDGRGAAELRERLEGRALGGVERGPGAVERGRVVQGGVQLVRLQAQRARGRLRRVVVPGLVATAQRDSSAKRSARSTIR